MYNIYPNPAMRDHDTDYTTGWLFDGHYYQKAGDLSTGVMGLGGLGEDEVRVARSLPPIGQEEITLALQDPAVRGKVAELLGRADTKEALARQLEADVAELANPTGKLVVFRHAAERFAGTLKAAEAAIGAALPNQETEYGAIAREIIETNEDYLPLLQEFYETVAAEAVAPEALIETEEVEVWELEDSGLLGNLGKGWSRKKKIRKSFTRGPSAFLGKKGRKKARRIRKYVGIGVGVAAVGVGLVVAAPAIIGAVGTVAGAVGSALPAVFGAAGSLFGARKPAKARPGPGEAADWGPPPPTEPTPSYTPTPPYAPPVPSSVPEPSDDEARRAAAYREEAAREEAARQEPPKKEEPAWWQTLLKIAKDAYGVYKGGSQIPNDFPQEQRKKNDEEYRRRYEEMVESLVRQGMSREQATQIVERTLGQVAQEDQAAGGQMVPVAQAGMGMPGWLLPAGIGLLVLMGTGGGGGGTRRRTRRNPTRRRRYAVA